MTDQTSVSYEVRGAVALVTLDRPAQLNAINLAVLEGLDDATARVEQDRAVRALVLTGAGRAFCAGADIALMQSMSGSAEMAAYLSSLAATLDRIEALRVPVVAAIGGMAFGGGFELALVCDLLVLGEGAKLGLPEIRIGVLPGGGGTQRLTRLAGAALAKRLILTGDSLAAPAALALGLAAAVVPDDQVLTESMALADRLAALAPVALAEGKRLIAAAVGTELATGLELERRVVADLFDRDDRREGMSAFLEKRPARFSGA